MGEMIQIRVTAKIHDQEGALKKWAGLVKLAFPPERIRKFEGQDLLTELVDALYDKKRLGMLPDNLQEQLVKDIDTTHSLKEKMNFFLAERNPREADKISYQLEDVLNRMEEKADD